MVSQLRYINQIPTCIDCHVELTHRKQDEYVDPWGNLIKNHWYCPKCHTKWTLRQCVVCFRWINPGEKCAWWQMDVTEDLETKSHYPHCEDCVNEIKGYPKGHRYQPKRRLKHRELK